MNKKSKFLLLALITVFIGALLCVSAFAEIYTGECGAEGDNVTYKLDTETGLLEITGTGTMRNYSFLTSIPWYSYKSSVKTVKITDGVTSIGSNAFCECNSLKSVTIPNSLTIIHYRAFDFCSSLTSVTIPDSVTGIGDSAFYSCNSLTSITIPDSVTSIGDSAFGACSRLTSATIGDSVTSIGSSAFSSCRSLITIKVDEDNEYYCDIDGVLFTKNKDTLVSYPGGDFTTYTFPDSVSSIGNGAFRGCGLTSVNISRSVTSIGNVAFDQCNRLTSVTIPDSVTSIGDFAFYSCSNLTNVTFLTRDATIGTSAFDKCSNLETIYLYKNSTADDYFSDTEYTKIYLDDEADTSKCDYEYTINDDGTSVTITKYIGLGGNVVIPQKLDGYDVTIIGDTSFSKCETLTSVAIPEGVTSIGYSAFEYCGNLASVTFPETLNIINDFAFYYCDALVTVTIPESVTKIGTYAFRSCGSLTSVTFLTKTTTIGSSSFDYCDKLETIYLYRNSTADTYFPDEGYTKIYLDAVHTCSPEGDWIYSADSHWKLCSCGNVVNQAAHVDADKNEICDYCAHNMHVHSPKGVWIYDNVNHWQLCSCGIKILEGAHVDANSDEICDDCGHTISISGGIIEIGSATTVRGNTVSVDITISENPGISGLLLKFDFNRDALKLKEIVYKNWNVQGEDNLGEASSDDHISILFYNEDDITYNGQIATLIFEVIEDAPIGEHTIDLYYIEAVNKDQINVIITATDGKITVRQSIAGDVNFDGRVSIKDNVLLAQYLAGWGVTVDTNAADCNGDGVISVKDIVLLSQYLSDWDVALITIN